MTVPNFRNQRRNEQTARYGIVAHAPGWLFLRVFNSCATWRTSSMAQPIGSRLGKGISPKSSDAELAKNMALLKRFQLGVGADTKLWRKRSMVRAATSMSSGSTSSSGLWLIPLRHRTKSMPTGTKSAMAMAS